MATLTAIVSVWWRLRGQPVSHNQSWSIWKVHQLLGSSRMPKWKRRSTWHLRRSWDGSRSHQDDPRRLSNFVTPTQTTPSFWTLNPARKHRSQPLSKMLLIIVVMSTHRRKLKTSRSTQMIRTTLVGKIVITIRRTIEAVHSNNSCTTTRRGVGIQGAIIARDRLLWPIDHPRSLIVTGSPRYSLRRV